MKSRYIIALIPTTKAKQIVELSNKLSDIADRYLLGNSSIPHVTLYHFDAYEDDIKDIWVNVSSALTHEDIELVFDNFSCSTFDNVTFWALLLPNKVVTLSEMHEKVAEKIKCPIKNNYHPHMTLINSKNNCYEDKVNEIAEYYKTISDRFVLSLGRADEIGQYLEIIHSNLPSDEMELVKELRLGLSDNLSDLFTQRTKRWPYPMMHDECFTIGTFEDLIANIASNRAFALLPVALDIALLQSEKKLLICALSLIMDLASSSGTTEQPVKLVENRNALYEKVLALLENKEVQLYWRSIVEWYRLDRC
jgi:2'-5' RNA ligase